MKKGLVWATVLLALPSLAAGQGQKMPPLPPPTAPAVAPTPAANAPVKLSLDEAIRLALQHNHALLLGAHDNSAKPSRGSDGEPAAQSHTLLGLAIFSAVQPQPIQRGLS